METSDPFRVALRGLVIEQDFATRTGNANWSAFAAQLRGVHYETLRRVVAGQRAVSPRLMEECARVLGIRPEYFLEYRVHLAQRDFDPNAVGLERALRNLQAWARGRPSGEPTTEPPLRPSP
jgi:plasmid maintenance system antidote protein VapI